MSKITAITLYDKEPDMRVVFDTRDFVVRYTVKELLTFDFTESQFIQEQELFTLTITPEDLKVTRISLEEVLKLQDSDYISIVSDYEYLNNGAIKLIVMEPFSGRLIVRREE